MTDLNVLRQRLTAAVTDINRLTDELEQVRAQLTGAQQQVKQYQDGYRALEAELAAPGMWSGPREVAQQRALALQSRQKAAAEALAKAWARLEELEAKA